MIYHNIQSIKYSVLYSIKKIFAGDDFYLFILFYLGTLLSKKQGYHLIDMLNAVIYVFVPRRGPKCVWDPTLFIFRLGNLMIHEGYVYISFSISSFCKIILFNSILTSLPLYQSLYQYISNILAFKLWVHLKYVSQVNTPCALNKISTVLGDYKHKLSFVVPLLEILFFCQWDRISIDMFYDTSKIWNMTLD